MNTERLAAFLGLAFIAFIITTAALLVAWTGEGTRRAFWYSTADQPPSDSPRGSEAGD